MNVLSLFDGISCGQVALQRAGIPVSKYFASEIDKTAIVVTQRHFPKTVQLGDVALIKAKHLPKIDILLAGSPCQGFSKNGKMKGFEDPRSSLYYEFLRLLRTVKPKFWLLENVKGTNHMVERISKDVGRQPLIINSSLISAQSRIRCYWTNIPRVTVLKDRGILLGHVVSSANKSYTRTKGYVYTLKRLRPVKRDSITKNNTRLRREIRKALGTKNIPKFLWRFDKHGRIVVLYPDRRKIQLVGSVAFMDNKAECITTMSQPHMIDYNHTIRKLTEEECEELQTLPRGYTKGISRTARYRSLGNCWTVEVVSHILKGIKKASH